MLEVGGSIPSPPTINRSWTRIQRYSCAFTGDPAAEELLARAGEGRSRSVGPHCWANGLEKASALRPRPLARGDKWSLLPRPKAPSWPWRVVTSDRIGCSADGAPGSPRGRDQKACPPHLFRYSAATWMRTKGLDPLTIVRVMGWTSLRMLQRIYDQASRMDDFDAMAWAGRASR